MVIGDIFDLGCNKETNNFKACFSATGYLPKDGWDF